jgi:hypothetical protein
MDNEEEAGDANDHEARAVPKKQDAMPRSSLHPTPISLIELPSF